MISIDFAKKAVSKKPCQDSLKFSRGFPKPHDFFLAKMVCQPKWQPNSFLASKFSRIWPAKRVFGYKMFTGLVSPKLFFGCNIFMAFASQICCGLQKFHGVCTARMVLATFAKLPQVSWHMIFKTCYRHLIDFNYVSLTKNKHIDLDLANLT